ncbi:MAG: hypothetical protein PHF00_07935 [Elusimicrobia bacterium]|nr:hypothetical protein [Elusimicrobiota bacterium]
MPSIYRLAICFWAVSKAASVEAAAPRLIFRMHDGLSAPSGRAALPRDIGRTQTSEVPECLARLSSVLRDAPVLQQAPVPEVASPLPISQAGRLTALLADAAREQPGRYGPQASLEAVSAASEESPAEAGAWFDGRGPVKIGPAADYADLPAVAVDDFGIFEQAARALGRYSLEVGAEKWPICRDCIQVDKYRSQYDLFYRGSLQKGHSPEAAAARAFGNSEAPWAAAASKGALADAVALSFAETSVSMVASKNFPWFGPLSLPEVVRPILEEYRRVLKPGGFAVLLADGALDRRDWPRHIAIARSLGFSALYVKIGKLSAGGILLVKKSDP